MRIANVFGVFLFATLAGASTPVLALEQCQTEHWSLSMEQDAGGRISLTAEPIPLSTGELTTSASSVTLTEEETISTEPPSASPVQETTITEVPIESFTPIDEQTTPAQTESDMVLETSDQPTAMPSETPNTTPVLMATVGDVRINELVSDPVTGGKEWVELYNTSLTPFSLEGWSLQDGSKKTTMLHDAIEAYGFFVIQSPLGALNNDGDLVQLYDHTGTLMDEISYGNWSVQGRDGQGKAVSDPYSLGRLPDGTGAFIETITTPQAPNQAHLLATTATTTHLAAATDTISTLTPLDDPYVFSESALTNANEAVAAPSTEAVETAATVPDPTPTTTPLNAIAVRALSPGSPFQFLGTVANLPGLFGTNRIYITSGEETLLFASQKAPTTLPIGTPVLVTGIRTAAKTYDAAAQSIEEQPGPLALSTPKAMEIGSLTDLARGTFVQVQGTIASVAERSFTLVSVDGNLVRIVRPIIMATAPKKGMEARVAGFVEPASGMPLLYPSSQQAIALVPHTVSAVMQVKSKATKSAGTKASKAKVAGTKKAPTNSGDTTKEPMDVLALDTQRSNSLKWSITSASLAAMVTAALRYFMKQPIGVATA